MNNPIRVGVVGYGYWGPNLVRNFSELDSVDLVEVCDINPKRLALFAKRYPAVTAQVSFEKMVNDSALDAIAIATPVKTHYELASQALRAGKHVLVEKPIASTIAEAEELIALARSQALVLMVDHTFIYTGAVRKIREIVASGQAGDLYYYDGVRINLGLFQHDVNVLSDLAIHDLSVMDFIIGRAPVAVSCTGMSHISGQPENIAYLTLFFENNLIAHLHVNWLAPVKIRRTLIGGSQKMIVYDDLEPSEKIRVYDKGVDSVQSQEKIYQMLISYRTGDAWLPKIDTTEALAVEVAHFADCIRDHAQPMSDGQSGLRMLRILHAATDSMKRRGEPIEL